jgi:hypothetical protein
MPKLVPWTITSPPPESTSVGEHAADVMSSNMSMPANFAMQNLHPGEVARMGGLTVTTPDAVMY